MPRRYRLKLSQADIDDYAKGASQEIIGARYGVSQCCVRDALVRAGIRIHGKTESGKFLHGALVRQQATGIIRRYLAGENTPTLARAFLVSDRIILKILRENGITVRSAAESRALRKKAGVPWFKRSKYSRSGTLFVIPCPRCGQERLFDNAKKKARESLCRACGGKKRSAALQGIPLDQWERHTCSWSKGIAHTKEYREWRTTVLVRDSYECVACGAARSKSNKISVHHIERKIDNRTAIFDVDNGITLCMRCHGRINWHESLFAPLYRSYVEWRKEHPATPLARDKILKWIDPVKLSSACDQLEFMLVTPTSEVPAEPVIPGQAS